MRLLHGVARQEVGADALLSRELLQVVQVVDSGRERYISAISVELFVEVANADGDVGGVAGVSLAHVGRDQRVAPGVHDLAVSLLAHLWIRAQILP